MQRRNQLQEKLLVSFYCSTIESVLTYGIMLWFGACLVADKRRLQRVIKTAEKIIGHPLPPIEDIACSRCLKRAAEIVADPSYPAHYLSTCCHLANDSGEESLPDGFFKLKKPVGATLKRAKLEDTIYKDNFAVMNGWGKFYLPNTVNMQVVGVVDGISCPCDQLVLMTAHCSENRKVYAYDKKRLHCVALSIEELLKQGMEYPASESYYNGEAFKDMPSENWADTRTSSLGRRLDEEYKKMVASRKSSFLENLKHSTKQMLKSY